MKPVAAAVDSDLLSQERLELLTRLNAQDLITAFKLDRLSRAGPLIEWLARIPARRFSRQIMQLDDLIGAQGLAAGGRYIVSLFARSLTIEGLEHVPATGPLLIVSNHPGMADAMALWVALEQRPDLRIIAAHRELLHAIPNASRRMLYVATSTGGRTGMLRSAVSHLQSGGALLTFPAGKIEPDPTVRPNAIESLRFWSPSMALFIRMVAEVTVLPVAVGGVISGSAMRNPLLHMFAEQRDRDWAAATLQVLMPAYRDSHTHVAMGPALAGHNLVALGSAEAITHAVTDAMIPLLQRVAGEGVGSKE